MSFGKLCRSLYFQVIVAILIGVALGIFAPQTGAAMKPFGDAFIKLVKMIIAPVIFCTVVIGIAGASDMKQFGKTGALALLYFEVVSTIALIIGLVIVNTVRPGAGMNIDPLSLDASALGPAGHKLESTKDFLLNIIPNTMVDAFARGEILQVLFIAILAGMAIQRLGPSKARLLTLIEDLAQVLFEIVGLIMRLAPIGAFGAMAFTVGSNGAQALLSMGKLMGTFYLTCLAFIFLVLGSITRFHGFSIWRFLRYIREELFIVLGTSSSEAALPRMLAKMETLGAGRSTAGLVIPTGYSFNLDGTSIYLTMAAIFIAQATNTPMTLLQQITLLAVLLLTSKGAAGVTGSGFIVLGATLSVVGNVPVAGLALILGIDRFMSEARAITNVIGNGVATLVVAQWTGDLDKAVRDERLRDGPAKVEEAEAEPGHPIGAEF
ncbi:MAG TPA: dicarboxylate/amino acid:cation symporter [Bryobacteraceae bacterium]|nr:dicarboxylate/amino acid:cation symporter [Bryobacteraceae bacterium]HPT26514.1 dicarboxylate/amino acid:cation symporter [Bryobacteraceae bacterium]